MSIIDNLTYPAKNFAELTIKNVALSVIYMILFLISILIYGILFSLVTNVTRLQSLSITIANPNGFVYLLLLSGIVLFILILFQFSPWVYDFYERLPLWVWSKTTSHPRKEYSDRILRIREYDKIYQQKKELYCQYFIYNSVGLIFLLTYPVIVVWLYDPTQPLTILAGIYLLIGILINSLPNAVILSGVNILERDELSAEISSIITSQMGLVLLFAAGVVQTTASIGWTTRSLLSGLGLLITATLIVVTPYVIIRHLVSRTEDF